MYYDAINPKNTPGNSQRIDSFKKGQVALAIEIQKTQIRVALVRDNSIIIGKVRTRQYSSSIFYSDLLQHIENVANAVLRAYKDIHPIGIGICAGGSVDIINQTMRYKEKTADGGEKEDEMPIAYDVSDRLNLPACLLSSCKAGIIGEHRFGDASKFSTAVYLYITNDGIGAGIMHDSHLLIGEAGRCGGAGHLIVDTKFNRKCTCNGEGHWKAYMTPENLVSFYNDYYAEKHTTPAVQNSKYEDILDELYVYAEKESKSISNVNSDAPDNDFYNEFKCILSRGIMNIVALYNPGIIIIDGPLVKKEKHYRLFHQIIVNNTNSKLFQARSSGLPVIRASKNEGYACLMGAAAYVFKLKNDSKNGVIGEQWYFPRH